MKKVQKLSRAKLFTCARCEWIFKLEPCCPKCEFAYYSAHYVYGKAAYRYAISQKPYKRKLGDKICVQVIPQ